MKKVQFSLTNATHYHDSNGRLIREQHTSTTYQPECNLAYQYDASGAIIGFTYHPYSGTATQYFFGKNAQGDVICIYDAWGNILSVTGSMASTLGAANPFRYRGYYYDTESGWYYLNSRYYDPLVGRFINADGIVGSNGGITGYNMFAYCNNNPVMYVDPNGLCKHRANGYCEQCQKETIISGTQKEELPLIESPEEHGTYPTSEEIFAQIVDWSAEHGALKVERDSLKKQETSAEIVARLISEKNALFQYRGIIFSGIVAAAPGFYNNLLCGASSEKLFYDAFIDFSFGATIHMMSAGIITMAGITCPISVTTFLLTNLISLALNSLVDIFGVKEQLKSFV